ncbi:MAG TPA: TMEM175 family protein [Chitinophagaceae bacterium]|nr:TMEM175 family protein [Chitinophagaceae bacterium]
MSNQLHNELRKEFQLERLILFSDAVFAIAITLLVIEIKIPELGRGQVTDDHLLEKLTELIPKFVGFLVSFLIIGQYWIVHHRMFGYVINFNQRLIWLNLFFLLCVALMPFSTGFYSEYAGMPVLSPVIFYTCNIAMLGILNFFMWRYLSNPDKGLTENLSPQVARYSSIRAITVPVIFIICTIVYTQSPVIAAFIPMTIPLILKFVFGPMKRKIIANSKQQET